MHERTHALRQNCIAIRSPRRRGRAALTACLAPLMSASRPAQTRDRMAAANWLPATRPTRNVPRPRPSCTCSGSTGIANPMTIKAIKTAAIIGSSAVLDAPCCREACNLVLSCLLRASMALTGNVLVRISVASNNAIIGAHPVSISCLNAHGLMSTAHERDASFLLA